MSATEEAVQLRQERGPAALRHAPKFEIRNLHFYSGEHRALHDVSLTVEQGRIVRDLEQSPGVPAARRGVGSPIA